MSDLRSRISRASLAQGATALVGKAANLVLGIVLARLLFPEDYGLFAIALVVTSLATLLGNFGFQSFLIQARELEPRVVDVCYSLNVGLSLLLGAATALVGLLWPEPPDLLPGMLALYGLYVLLSGLSYVQLALLKRELDFARSSRAELAYTLGSMGGRVGFAAAGFGALCFPLGDLLGALLRHWMAAGAGARLRLVLPRRGESREALWFGLHSTSVGMASFFGNQTDKFLLALQFPFATLGLYAFAGNASAMFYNAIIVPQTGVFLATFARLRDDVRAARDVLATSTRLIYSMALPVNLLLVLETERIIEVVFTEKWLPAAPLVRVLAVDFVVRSMLSSIAGLQMSFGRAGEAARTKWRSAMLVVAALLLATALQADIAGYALASMVGNVLATCHNAWANGRLLDLRWAAYLRNLVAPTAVAIASTFAWWLARPYWETLPSLPALAAAAATWLSCYLLLSWFGNRMIFAVPLRLLRGGRP